MLLVLGNTTQNHDSAVKLVVSTSEICLPPHTIHKRKQSRRVINDLDKVDFIPSNVQFSNQLYLFEDNETVINSQTTKGNFTRDEWNHLLKLFNISHFSSTVCSETIAKRFQQDSGQERVTAKSRPI